MADKSSGYVIAALKASNARLREALEERLGHKTEEILMSEEISFHDEASITVTATRISGSDNISLDISTAVSVGVGLSVGEAAELSAALAAAVKALAAPPQS
jgi:hypothetical protein